MDLDVERADLALARPFKIATGTRRRQPVVHVRLRHGDLVGYGEAAPSRDVTGETPATVVTFLEAQREDVEALDPDDWSAFLDDLHATDDHPAARAALDLALHDLAGRMAGEPVHALYDLPATTRPTCMTVSLDDPKVMVEEARGYADEGFRHVKLKLGDARWDVDRVRAVREALPDAVLRVDANMGWTAAEARVVLPELADLDVLLVEQPVPAEHLDDLLGLADTSPTPIYADEAVLGPRDVDRLARRGFAGGVNLKLMKTGGIRPTMEAAHLARDAGFPLQLGCMVESGVGVTAAAHLLALVDHADLDGNLLLAHDPLPGPRRQGDEVGPRDAPGLGVEPAPEAPPAGAA